MQRKKAETPLDSQTIQELEDLTLKILSRNPFGLPVSKISQALPAAYRRFKIQLPAVLDSLLAKKKLYLWQPSPGKSKSPPLPLYSIEPLPQVISHRIVDLLPSEAMTLAELKKHFPAPVKTHIMLFLEPLLGDRIVKRHPPSGKTKKFGRQDPDPIEFLSSEIKKLLDKGRSLGFGDADIADAVRRHGKPLDKKHASALSISQIENAVFKAMTDLKSSASQGALVYIPDLRDALRGIFRDKETFDQAIMELAKIEKVQLQSHSLPDTLSGEQKSAMIDNLRGGYFMAVGKRME
jgi:hypothetical protein